MARPLRWCPLLLCLPGAVAASADTVVELDRVQVQGRARTLYRSEDATVATRSDTPLSLVPQSVQVVPRQLIDDQAARQVTDLYRNIAGLSQFNYASVMLRGFRQENVLYDGMRGDPYGGLTVPQLFTIERVEVLKGPSGAVFGSGDPGGVINYVTRKPLHTLGRRLRLQLGNEMFGAASFEATGPWQRLPALRYRAGVYADSQTGPRWNADSANRIADFALAMDMAEQSELSLQYTALAQDLGGNRLRGVPVDDDGRFLANPRWSHNEADDFQRLRSQVALARFTSSPTPAWDFDATVRWTTSRDQQVYHEPRGLIDRNGDGVANWMTRELRHQHRSNDTLAAAANTLWRMDTGRIAHKVGAGIDYLRGAQSFRGQTARPENDRRRPGPVPGIALRDPRYGTTQFRDYGLERLPWIREPANTRRKGVYLQDEMALSTRWYLLAGLRWDGFEDTDERSGQVSRGSDPSWRLGATWHANAHFNLYANLASGFMPQAAASQRAAAGGPFDAQRSRQWEAGVKASPLGERLSLTAALYRIERRNILQATGQSIDGVDQMQALGLVRSQGAELEVLADLGERWALSLAYAYNDAGVMRAGRDGIATGVGQRFANAPRNAFGSWLRYDIPAWSSALGAGVDYMGERISTQGQRIRPYTLFDASWQTRAAGWQWQLSLKNLFDRVYATSGMSRRNGHFPGEPRRIYLQATYEF